MRLTTIIIVGAALAVSVLTAFMIQWYLGSRAPKSDTAREVIPAERVLVAKNDLTGGTVMKAKEHFGWQAWPKSGLRKEFVLKGSGLDKEFVGAVLRQNLKAGVPLTAQLLYRGGEKGFVASGLKPGMRAVAIKVDPEIGVGGFARSGDRVDIILTSTVSIIDKDIKRKVRNSSISRKISETIVRNVRVIAINQNVASSGKNEKKPKVATLEVTEKQAEILANARRMGKMLLALRSHTPAPEKPLPRRFQFTSDLEILSSMRGGLAAHLDEINKIAEKEFNLNRWVSIRPDQNATPGSENAQKQSAGKQTPKVIRRLASQPKSTSSTTARRTISPKRTKSGTGSLSPAQAAMEKKLQELEKKLKTQEDEQRKAKQKPTKVVKSEKKAVSAKRTVPAKPTSKVTVRVDRAGTVQTMKFKEAQ